MPLYDSEEEKSAGNRHADFLLFNNHEHNNTHIPGDSNLLIYTPVEINGVSGAAVVDSGATKMFIAQQFCR